MQIGIRHEVRRVTSIGTVAKDLKNGDVFFEPIYRYTEESSAARTKVGEIRELNTSLGGIPLKTFHEDKFTSIY